MATSMAPSIRERVRRSVPGRIRRSYAAKILVGFLVVLGSIGAVIYVQSSAEFTAVTESRLESNSELQGMVHSQWLEEMKGQARQLSEMANIDAAIDEQAASTLEAVGMDQNVTATSEQVNRESETVAAAAEEQAASLTEVTENASRLAERATELSDALSSFAIGEAQDQAGVGDVIDPGDGAPAPADD